MKINPLPLVSIITPCYNSEEFIAITIASIQAQSYSNWELLLIDDASNDKTVAVINNIAQADERIKCFVNDVNSGAAVSRNKGLENAKGRFIAFLDSDDLWHPNKLEIQIEFVIKNKAAISFTSYELVDEIGKPMNKVVNSVPRLNYTQHLKNTAIGMSTSMIDTDIVTKKFAFVDIRTRQDCYLWITLLKRGHEAHGIPNVMASYRVRRDSISSNKVKAAKQVWYLYYHLEKLGIVKSSYYFCFYVFNALKKRL